MVREKDYTEIKNLMTKSGIDESIFTDVAKELQMKDFLFLAKSKTAKNDKKDN